MTTQPKFEQSSLAGADAGSLKRGVQILKILATVGARGLALTEIAGRSGLPHPSVHRLLRQLTEDRLVARHEHFKRYRLGPLAFELGIACSSTYGDLRDLCDDAMGRLALETGDTTFLVARSGFDAVCLHRHEGSYPVRALVLDIGGRRPLGLGAGGLALLAALDMDEQAQIIERISSRLLMKNGVTAADIQQACERTGADGLAVVHETLCLGVSAVGHVFRDRHGQAVGALSVAALSHRLAGQRRERVGALIKEAAKAVEGQINRTHLNGWRTGI